MRLDPNPDDLFGLLVAVELFAVVTGRFPPLTHFCRRYPAATVGVVGVVLAHVYAGRNR